MTAETRPQAVHGPGAFRTVTDEDVLASYVAGRDRDQAFSELMDRYSRRVYAICYRYFANHADAEDATQDTFVAIARRAATFSANSKLSTWVYRVAINACNDLARKRTRRPSTPVADVPDAVDDTASGHDDAVIAADTGATVQRALLQLDELSRTLLILVAIEGLTYVEAADIAGLPIGTVKSRVHRARARLADLLADHLDT